MTIADSGLPRGLREGIALAPLTTLELGGPARYLVEAGDEETVADALRWAGERGLPVSVLGGGSNVVVADAGVDGLVLRIGLRGVAVESSAGSVLVTAAAGEPWDDLAARCVAEGWGGLECLSGIPGTAGATPIQNVGAYGQEVGQTIERVRVLDRRTLEVRDLGPADLGFGYRSSALRERPGRWVVLAVSFGLRVGGAPTVAYPELERALAAGRRPPSLAAVREAVLELRRGKSMVLDAEDPNRRSAGSFFVNPVLSAAQLTALRGRVAAAGIADELPTFAADRGGRKVPAAWLIERAGFAKGHASGRVGISTRHSLALVNHGGATAAELVGLARRIVARVDELFGVRLRPEPVFLGFPESDPLGSGRGR
jgi:UDP-N-acetylmuramate dehydrogenase